MVKPQQAGKGGKRAASLLSAAMAVSLAVGSLSGCATSNGPEEMTLDLAETNGIEAHQGPTISLTQARSYVVSVPVQGKTTDEVKALVDTDALDLVLDRETGAQDATEFPNQYLGGSLKDWRTVATSIQDEESFFKDIVLSVTEHNGTPVIEASFATNEMYNSPGIDTVMALDGEDSELVVNTILDYTGPYQLRCVADGEELGSTTVEVRPYDDFVLQQEVGGELEALAAEAQANGLFASVEQIGESAQGRPINAIFVAKSESDLQNYQVLSERAEIEPAAVQEEVRAGQLEYKVPILYSNVHSAEVIGTDGVMAFLRELVKNEQISYRQVASLTEVGQQQLVQEMEQDGKAWSSLFEDEFTGIGYIQGEGQTNPLDPYENPDATVNMSDEEFSSYYNVDDKQLDVEKVLDDVFFILVPMENPDGRAHITHANGNGFDLNRDNTFQTQPETRAMTNLIASWNPISFHEIHGYYTQFQIEPCTPTHDPNNEYDLFVENAINQGETFAATAIANTDSINSAQIPLRDYLFVDEDGQREWLYPFDDMSTSYTPQYAMMHGVNAYTIELPYGSREAVEAVKYGFIGNADFVVDNKDSLYLNQLERYRRGVENIDADEIRPYYVSQTDEVGVEADVFRPRHAENNNFFPEYYVIPVDAEHQQDRGAAVDMIEYLLRNDVKVDRLAEDFVVNSVEYPAGTMVVDMHQAKRNMANGALYSNMVVDSWGALYSEPVSNFSDLRGFDMDVITTPDAFASSVREAVEEAPRAETIVEGEGAFSIIANDSVDAVQAVNRLLASGSAVGLVVEGEQAGNYVVAGDISTMVSDCVLNVTRTDTAPKAREMKGDIKVYVPGAAELFTTYSDGQQHGVANYGNYTNQNYSWDRAALGTTLGFTLVESAEEADVIVGNSVLSDEEKALVAAGKPYVGYTENALAFAKELNIGLDYLDSSGVAAVGLSGTFDALSHVEYPADSLITATYRHEGDDVVYGYGGNFITKVPEGAEVLMKISDQDAISGFMAAEHAQAYKGSVQAIDYEQDGLDLTIFANTLTNKEHQRDDYRFISAAIYEKTLGDGFEG